MTHAFPGPLVQPCADGIWRNNGGDELERTRAPLDTTPLARNPKQYRFRDGSDSRVVYKTVVKLGGR